MPDFTVFLGDFAFAEFEIPASVTAGGAQTLAIHKYPGGWRTIDAAGPDDADITWSGTFTGPDAEARCAELNAMRRQGLALPFTFSQQSWTVVIRSFTFVFKRFYQIDYSIALAVITDLTQQPVDSGASDDGDFSSFGADADDQCDALQAIYPDSDNVPDLVSGFATAMDSVTAAVATLGPPTAAAFDAITTTAGVISTAADQAAALTASFGSLVENVGGTVAAMASGIDPIAMAGQLNMLALGAAGSFYSFAAFNDLAAMNGVLADQGDTPGTPAPPPLDGLYQPSGDLVAGAGTPLANTLDANPNAVVVGPDGTVFGPVL